MARASALADRADRLDRAQSDESIRYIDFFVQFREIERVERDDRANLVPIPTGRMSPLYGWRFDTQIEADDGRVGDWADLDEVEDPLVLVLDATPTQFELLCDDETRHTLVVGSRRSGKTGLLERWHVKQIARWQGKSISFMREKRQKLRKYVDERLKPLLPDDWLGDDRSAVRMAQDEIAITCQNGTRLFFLTAKVPDDARGDGIPAGAIDETQLIDPEARDNFMLSLSEGGSDFQTLETGTLLEGEFEDYLERARESDHYNVVELSITDNVFLETEHDAVTGCEIPKFVITRREMMDPIKFAREIGVWCDETERYLPTMQKAGGRVHYAFTRRDNVARWRPDRARTIVCRAVGDVSPGVGLNVTRERTLQRGGAAGDFAVGTCLEHPLFAAVAGQLYSTPPGVPDLVWVTHEASAEEANAGSLVTALAAAGVGSALVVPDAVGRHSENGRTGIQALTEQAGFVVAGTVRNPADVDCINKVNARCKAQSRRITLLIDPRCENLLRALRRWQRNEKTQRPSVMKHSVHHYAIALWYLVHYFTSDDDVRAMARKQERASA